MSETFQLFSFSLSLTTVQLSFERLTEFSLTDHNVDSPREYPKLWMADFSGKTSPWVSFSVQDFLLYLSSVLWSRVKWREASARYGSLTPAASVRLTCSGDTRWISALSGSGSLTSSLCSACLDAPELAPNNLRTWAERRGSARAAAPTCRARGPERSRRRVRYPRRARAAAEPPELPSPPVCRSVCSANQRARFSSGQRSPRGHDSWFELFSNSFSQAERTFFFSVAILTWNR